RHRTLSCRHPGAGALHPGPLARIEACAQFYDCGTAIDHRRRGGFRIMKAAVLTGSGIEVREAPKTKPAANQVLVRVRAAGLNRADLIMASGHMHGSAGGPGTVLGLEFAGEVEAVGSEVKGIK